MPDIFLAVKIDKLKPTQRIDLNHDTRYTIFMDISPKTADNPREIFVSKPSTPKPLCIEVDSVSQTLAQALWLSGKVQPVPLCSGLGQCGACKVQFLQNIPQALAIEEKILGQEAVKLGWRLACRQPLAELFATNTSVHVALPPQKEKALATPKDILRDVLSDVPKNKYREAQDPKSYFLAIDLGTTSLCWKVLDTQGSCYAEGSELNPQMGAGADIISRLRFAMHHEGKHILAQAVQTSLQNIIEKLPSQSHVQEIGLAANTAMTAIFLEKDITGLCHAPYAIPLQGNSQEEKQNLPPIYIPPQLAPFVGGDISAGYAALLARQAQGESINFPFILADLGTNGEFILAIDAHKAFIASVPMGPALEGIGLSHGHMVDGSPGIVYAVGLNPTAPSGLSPSTIDGSAPQKLCGTGYISLIQSLYKAGMLSESGLFLTAEQHKRMPFVQKIATHLITDGEDTALKLWPELAIKYNTAPMYLYAKDVEEVLKVKAAFSLAMAQLLAVSGLAPKDLRHIFLAGAMGKHVQVQNLEGLGFIPAGAGSRVTALGNSALEGIGHLLLQKNLRETLHQWSKNCTLLQLTEDEHFTEKFVQHMNFSYTG